MRIYEHNIFFSEWILKAYIWTYACSIMRMKWFSLNTRDVYVSLLRNDSVNVGVAGMGAEFL